MSDLEKTSCYNHVSSGLEEFEEDTDERIQAKLKKVTGLDVVDQIESLDLQITPNDTILSRGCKWLTNLGFLCLSYSNISSLRDLGSLPALKVLWISECSLNSLDGICNLPRIQQLYASCNNISDLYPCIFLEELSYLDVEGNQVSDFTSVESLVLCPCLSTLILKENPICYSNKQREVDFDYCEAVRNAIPQLEILDGVETSTSSHLPSCKSSIKKNNKDNFNEFTNSVAISPENYGSCSPKYHQKKPFPRSSSPNELTSAALRITSKSSELTKDLITENNIPNNFYIVPSSACCKIARPFSPDSSKLFSPCSRHSSDCSRISSPYSRPCSICSKSSASYSRPSSGSSKQSSPCSRPCSNYSEKHLKSTHSIDSCDEISISNLSEDFSSSLSYSGHVFCGNPGRAFRSLRSDSTSTSHSRGSSDDEEEEKEEENYLKGFWSEITEDNNLQSRKNQNNKKRCEKWAFPVAVDANEMTSNSHPDDAEVQYIDFSYDGDESSLNSTFPQDEENLQNYMKNMGNEDSVNVREHLNSFQPYNANRSFIECEMRAPYQVANSCLHPPETYSSDKEFISLDQNMENCQELSLHEYGYPSIYSLKHDLVPGISVCGKGSDFCDLVECSKGALGKKNEAAGKQLVLESALTTWKRIEDTGLGQKLPNNKSNSNIYCDI